MNTSTISADKDSKKIFDYKHWEEQLAANAGKYQQAGPYPHIQLEDFLEPWAAEQALAEFPSVKDEGWIHYVHINEKKHGLNKLELLPPFIQEVIKEMNSPAFVSYLSRLTGIPNLLADDMLEGGGLHQSQRNGFLNVHADFTVHPHKRNWRRRVNILIYLNKDWKPEYNGDLELWDRKMTGVQQKIAPLFNRCVIFNTDEDSYHGVPETILCPEDMTRKSIALYYFTEEEVKPTLRSTNYKSRPQDGAKSILIYLDKKMVAGYTRIKRALGINDAFISKILNKFGGKKK
ncbi:2OG-Fe(II) oxygenase [Taibaiella helva]|uniref:2OG-Fe(II) oxygenase n=1 Tax=Taibaiella helva TaxID=2301235 RepID=UPI000E56DB39|nr:2OG-Fe(II) oxygenase [Taibaiella helva]